jgi:predicted NAD-dependent protein-ADP-ribosyltransferase YbiA (DUF1768 family)
MIRYLRKLAKTTEMLNLFAAAKDMGCFELFKNKNDLSSSQNYFLSYLYFYHSLHTDIVAEEVSEKVLTDEIYENAYNYYRSNKKEKKDNKKLNQKRTIQGVFSQNNKINFPTEDK